MSILGMEDGKDEEFLSLGLAIVAESCSQKRHKRKRRDEATLVQLDLNESWEGKIFSLLQMREQMMTKLDHHKRDIITTDQGADHHNHKDIGGKGLQLIHSLLISATSVDENDMDSVAENLYDLYQNISLFGDSLQRVAAYFADGLIARLLTRKSPFYDMIMKTPTQEEEFLAFTHFYKVSPFYQFAHFTANQAIMETFENEEPNNNRFLHIIDYDICYGFQWPSLIQSLSEIATSTNRTSLKITGYGRSLEELQETETRLVGFAKGFRSLIFEFQGLLRGSKIGNLKRKKNETVVVNLICHLNTLNSVSKIYETLKSVHMINPSIVVMVEKEGCKSPHIFLSRFMESLHYFAAMFDSLDDCLPVDSDERLNIEKNHLGKEIKCLINYDRDCVNSNTPLRYERMETWKARMESHGFSACKLSSKSLIQAKLLLKIRTQYSPVQFGGGNGGFRIFENDEGNVISLGWQDRCLITASAWHCVQ
ncbi:OLC1v1015478C1 [Oldenlandia corymbosa var. corymbosa]|uniref:OLC1v1015478C1 n=1 Tax=Oldenlandia corymbosa var. corymbosa TaxID=529605 RepID=A0AAV1E3C2_OLDCO|nr:OLC1v1015478C1 [Oldenlandia corymbosa var. corymbosa]